MRTIYHLRDAFTGHGFKLAPAAGPFMTRQLIGYQASMTSSRSMDPNSPLLTPPVMTHYICVTYIFPTISASLE